MYNNYGNYGGGGYNKSSRQGGYGNKPQNNISQKDRLDAEAALKSLKMKISNAPKPKPKQVNQNYNYPKNSIKEMGMGMGGGNYNEYDNMNFYGNNNKINNNNFGQAKPKNKSLGKPVAKKSIPGRKGLGPLNPNFGGGKIKSNPYGGGFGGEGAIDSRPIGGGMQMSEMPEEEEATSPCPHCGRNFNMTALAKHTKICQKVFQKKRKAFNMSKQRMNDPEQASLMRQGQMMEKKNAMLNKNKGGIPKWKLQSAEFRSICNPNKANKIRKEMGIPVMQKGGGNPKGGFKSGAKGKVGGGMGMGSGFGGGMNMDYGMGGNDMYGGGFNSAQINGYLHCQYCNRNYNEEAYHKHLNGCKNRYTEAQYRNKMNKKPAGKVKTGTAGGAKPKYGANKYGMGKK